MLIKTLYVFKKFFDFFSVLLFSNEKTSDECMMKIFFLLLSILLSVVIALTTSENVVNINTQDDLIVQALPFESGPSINSKDGTTFGCDSSSFCSTVHLRS